jgi:predicted ATPase
MLQFGRELNHPPSLAAALAFDLYIGLTGGWHRLEVKRRIDVADELLALAKKEGFALWYAQAMVFRGAAAAVEGAAAQAKSQMREGVMECVRSGARVTLVGMHVMCAQAYQVLGDADNAWKALGDAQTEADTRGERLWESEIDRVRAALLLRRGDEASAEDSLHGAIAKARAQEAVSLELRALFDLSDILVASGRGDEARNLVKKAARPVDVLSRHPALARVHVPASAWSI